MVGLRETYIHSNRKRGRGRAGEKKETSNAPITRLLVQFSLKKNDGDDRKIPSTNALDYYNPHCDKLAAIMQKDIMSLCDFQSTEWWT